jgi:hypothetical protein
MKITDAIQEFILYKQSLGMSYKNRALKLSAFAAVPGPLKSIASLQRQSVVSLTVTDLSLRNGSTSSRP